LITGLTPPGPVQVRTKVEFLVRGPVLCVPLVARVPLQAFEAVQYVALVELQVNVAEAPYTTAPPEFVINVAVGTGLEEAATETVVEATLLDPAVPVHLSV
jgi:hypothetical protein